MFTTFDQAVRLAQSRGPQVISVAVAQDPEVLAAIKAAEDKGLVRPLLVGDEKTLRPLARQAGLADTAEIVHVEDPDQAALLAAEFARQGRARILMKGLLNSSNFLKAVLHKEKGLRTGRLLCHLGVLELPGDDRLIFTSDGGLNVAPNLEAKREILINVLEALKNMGLTKPNVAVLSHNEQVSEKMPSTVEAAALAAMADELPPCVIEGPIAMDVVLNPEAARHKKIASRVSGRADVWLLPNIESGNLLAKALIHYARAKFAGLILGAARPIVLASRSDTPETKLNSIALAALSVPETIR